MSALRVLVVDDHPVFRRGLVDLLESEPQFKVVGEAATGEEARRLAAHLQPNVVLMDVNMPGIGGLVATRLLLAAAPQCRVVMLTVSAHEADLFAAINAGARGYLLKNASIEDILSAIRCVAAGEAVLSPAVTLSVLQGLRTSAPLPQPSEPLTSREQDVLALLAQGASNRLIAERLAITDNTVKTHVRHILAKLHLRSRTQVGALAQRLNLPS